LVGRCVNHTGDGRVMYLGSGSEAMEAALKLARQYHLERGDAQRVKVIASEKIAKTIENGSGTLWNGHTYMSHAIATAGALAVQQVIENENLLAKVTTLGGQLEEQLHASFGQHPHVGDIRGRGLFWTIELVKDRATKAPFAASDSIANKLGNAAQDRGMMTYPSQGCADGINGDHVLLAPSYTSTADEIQLIVETLSAAVGDVLSA